MRKAAKFVSVLGILLATAQLIQAQQSKIYRVGVLFTGSQDLEVVQGLRDGLKNAGYVEDKNLLLDLAAGKTLDQLRIVANTYNGKMDVVVTIGGAETQIAVERIKNIPIVFSPVTDPVRSGFVKTLARPQANRTGLTYDMDSNVHGKHLEIFREVVPSLRRVAVLVPVEDPSTPASLLAVRKVAARFDLSIMEKPVKTAAEAEQVVHSLSRNTVDGIFSICVSMLSDAELGPAAKDRRIPLYGCPTQVKKHGALVSYAPNLYYIGRRGAWYVNKILKGARPEDLPVENPTIFELVINLRTAKTIGVTIPPEVLQRADKLIR